jgi:hypothetical protein
VIFFLAVVAVNGFALLLALYADRQIQNGGKGWR